MVGATWHWWGSPVTVLHMPKHPLGWFTSVAPGATPAEQQARHEAMAMKLAAPEHREQVEHVLAPFSALLDRNPRALKRLVNAFGVARDLELLSGWNVAGDVPQQHETAVGDPLASLAPARRAPRGEPFRHRRDRQRQRPARSAKGASPSLNDPRVTCVVQGDAPDVQAKLDRGVVERCAGLS